MQTQISESVTTEVITEARGMYELQGGKLNEREECRTSGWRLSTRKGAKGGDDLTVSGEEALGGGIRRARVMS